MIEFTRDCNMRCVYCAVSQPTWKISTLNPSILDKIIEDLKNRGLKIAILHGHGETTIIDGWHEHAEKLLEKGIALTICTNLARQYSEKEFETLSKFTSITVSIDTIDPDLFRQLRKGGDLRRIIANQIHIQSLADTAGREIYWVWSSVIADRTINGILDLINFGISFGVKTFCLCNLTEHPDIPLKHPSKLTNTEARRALDILYEARDLCDRYDVLLDTKPGLFETLEAKVGKTNS